MDSVGKRCAAMEQGHRDLESHFVDFMPGPLGPPGGRNGNGATAAARGTTWGCYVFFGGEIEKEPKNFMKHMIFCIFFSDKRVFFSLGTHDTLLRINHANCGTGLSERSVF